ncbi:MAG: hypothetical protein JXA33_25865 [Anaerolineae bacterium]|nr:hypothetical protein [Anaerolineae bacterium]
MRILVRNTAAQDWKLVEPAEYNNEAELQRLLAESPALISVGEIREGIGPLVVAVSEFGLPGSGSTDLLAFSAEGAIAVIECKLANNAEIKRKVVGQILEYGAYLWGMTYEDVDAQVYQRRGARLADLVSQAVDEEAWDEEAFRSNVTHALKRGDFLLIVTVDAINEELNRTIQFLNGCGSPTFTFSALEMRRFHNGEIEMLVPYVHGIAPTTSPAATEKGRQQWNERTFFQTAHDELSEEVVNVIQALYDWTKKQADDIGWGTGKYGGSFIFYYRVNNNHNSIFYVTTRGILWFTNKLSAGEISQAALMEFCETLGSYSGFAPIIEKLTDAKAAYIKIQEVFVKQPEALAQFKSAVLRLGKHLHAEAEL